MTVRDESAAEVFVSEYILRRGLDRLLLVDGAIDEAEDRTPKLTRGKENLRMEALSP